MFQKLDTLGTDKNLSKCRMLFGTPDFSYGTKGKTVISYGEPIPEQNNKILIVESHKDIRNLLQRKLTNRGYICYETLHADQIIDSIRDEEIALLILDTHTQGMPVIELLSTVKDNHPDTAVIVTTPVGGTCIGIECKESGADEYITKPFILEEVVLTVENVLEKRRLENLREKYQRHLQKMVGDQTEKIRNSFFQSVTALVHALEAKDFYTSGHSQRVADLSVAISNRLFLPKQSIEKIKMAGLVHDIGKIGIKEHILNKPAGLTNEEFKQVREHPEIGEYILSPIVDDTEILKLVRNHHERYNGTGYPDRLKGTQIPFGTRILAVADAYDAMTSDRPYRKAMNSNIAFHQLKLNKGIQFDPEVVSTLFKLNLKELTTGIEYSPVMNY
ncbi:HD domain-containing phosphohydrolase [Chloroflexota bacterium]